MSEPNNTVPFSGIEAGGTLDISAIFGSSTPGDDLNPFEMDALPQEHAPAAEPEPKPVAEPEPVAESEPAAEPEPEQLSAAPAPEEKITTEPTRKQAIPPAEEPNLMPEC